MSTTKVDSMDLEIYNSQARYYAAAFDWPVNHQVEGIARLSGLAAGRVLEPMCGSARLLRGFASAGFETVGVDASAQLLAMARRAFSAYEMEGQWLGADVTGFSLETACDLAVCPVNSLAHLQTSTAMSRHLQAVARNLNSGCCYWVQLDLKAVGRKDSPERWDFELDGETLEFEWSVVDINPEFETHQDRILKDGEPIFQERHRMKRWTFQDWSALLARSPFELSAAYDGNSFEHFRADASLEMHNVFWQKLVKSP